MKKNLLFACMAAGMSLSTVYAEDVTPSNFLFKNHPIGKFQITNAGAGANPNVDLGTPGHVIAACGPAVADQFLPVLRECTCIVGSKWGNLLMVKGKDAAVEDGIAAPGSLNTGWWNLNFIGPKSVTAQTYRATIQMKQVTSMAPSEEETKLTKVNYVTGGGNNISLGSRKILYLGDEGWFQAELQGTIGTTDAARLRIEIPGGIMDQSALYIYEVRFQKNPTDDAYNSPNDGTPGTDAPLGAVETSLDEFSKHTGAFVTWGTGKIYINEAAGKKVNVFTVSGQKIKEFTADSNLEEITASTGVYLVNIDGQTTKVAL